MSWTVPEELAIEGIESRWIERWERDGTYRFSGDRPRSEVYSIDTPPPTASGSLHVGHIFSYTHTDTIARYHRMLGKDVFYPMGWDDNGLPTERRVEAYYGVTCDPTVSYDSDFTPPGEPASERRQFVPISRRNFIELCHELTAADEVIFEELFRLVGLSVDWSHQYTTVGERSQQVSQRAFLRNVARGEAYSQDAPSLWDTTFQTAVAQAELEDRDRPAAHHNVAFRRAGGEGEVVISTTRPELLVSCVALVAHPDDDRYQQLIGTTVVTPVFDMEVPVRAHELAQPDKGTGIAMICTFGDTTDVTWWRELELPTRAVIGKDGRFAFDPPGWLVTDSAQDAYARFAGKASGGARQVMVELLREVSALHGEPEKITHPVKFYERGEKPLEIIATRQWYIRNGGRSPELRAALVGQGQQFDWHPDYMRHRYENWVDGLNGDWLVSRQRFFGVPVPLWYRLDGNGVADYDVPLIPGDSDLPIDPQSHLPTGFEEAQRDQPGGFTGDPDVLDTWATSSLTPLLACGWQEDPVLFAQTYPMDLRPQAHEIIRTWLFSTVVRAHFETDSPPWRHAAISGWILDPDRKKMSKSKGNVVVPFELLQKHGSDAVRYWAANARPGTDTAFDTGQMKIGRRLVIKILNASRFALSLGPAPDGTTPSAALDCSLLVALADLVDEATEAFDNYDYARALQRTEAFFWSFCDDYLELVKTRAYGENPDGDSADSAKATLTTALSTLLRLFAPTLPFTTEEVWSWWQEGSIHRAAWPAGDELRALAPTGDRLVLRATADALGQVRKAKSDARLSMRTEVKAVTITGDPVHNASLRAAAQDLSDAGRICGLTFVEGRPQNVQVDLGIENDGN